MNKEIKRIDEKVQVQIQMLNEHEARREEIFASKFEAENSREKPRITYLESIQTSLNNSTLIKVDVKIIEFLILLTILITALVNLLIADKKNFQRTNINLFFSFVKVCFCKHK